jgi:hypothetical protein
MASEYKAGDVLQSTAFTCVRAIIAKEILPGFFEWYLAKPDRKGGFEAFGFARYSEIDTQSWVKHVAVR